MSACDPLRCNDVNDDAWNCIVNAMAQYGVTPSGDSGTASSNGFTVTWTFDRTAGSLTIQCLDSPFWAPCSTINSQISEVIENCINQNRSTG